MGRGKGQLIVRGDSLVADFYLNGERIRATLPGLSAAKKAHRKTAEEILTQIQADMSRGSFNLARYFPNHPKAARFRKGSDIQIGERLESWLERQRRTIENSTFQQYSSATRHHLVPHFGDIAMSDLTSSEVRDWINSLSISNKAINNALIPLRAIFSEAYQEGLIDENPLIRIKNLPRRDKEPQPFTPEEIRKILDATEGQLHNLFKFAFWTGLRSAELIALQWKDVNLKAGTAHIRTVRNRYGQKDRPKTASSIRNIELLQPAKDALDAQQAFTANEQHVFHNPVTGKPWTGSERVKRFWIRVLKRAGVPYRTPYTTRHTFASMMLTMNVNPMWVARQMGHSDWGMIRKIYGRFIPEIDTSVQDKIRPLWAQDGHKEAIND